MTEQNPNFGDQLDYEPKANPETGRELLPNPERGCGYLEEEKGYIRTDPVRGGDIPAFVTFDPPVPYKEGTLRSYQQFDGLGFQRSLGDDVTTEPNEDDLQDLWDRLDGSEDGDHWGAITTAYAEDLLMWVGETYYDDPEDFVTEAQRFGLSKGIPVSKRQGPPAINPMNTRVFLIHPTAFRVYEQPVTTENDDGEQVAVTDDDGDAKTENVRVNYMDDDNRLGEDDADKPVKTVPGVIGYSYLTRVVWTAPSDDDIPKWARQYEDTGQLDIVDVGEPVPDDEVDERLAEFDGSLNDPEIARKTTDALTEVAETLTPGHGGSVGDVTGDTDGDGPAATDDEESTDAPSDGADSVVPSDKDGRDVEAATPVDDVLPHDWGDVVDADTVDELDADALPSDYNERKALAADVDATVSAQPGGDELNEAILDAVSGGDD